MAMIFRTYLCRYFKTVTKNTNFINVQLLQSSTEYHSSVAVLEPKMQPASDGINLAVERNPEVQKANDFQLKAHYRFLYPEFLPEPKMAQRHFIRERLERVDMMTRRKQMEVPEFYVGCIMAVTASDPHSPGRYNRFVGICILRELHGLRSYFILRNHIDNQGVEIRYDVYNPLIQRIEVLRLERRLDEHLVYLRDAPPEYSTFSFDMEPVPFPESGIVPVNPIKVRLKPRPWFARWERFVLHGIDSVMEHVPENEQRRALIQGEIGQEWVKYDLMKKYWESIHEEDQALIWEEAHIHHLEVKDIRRKDRKKRLLEKQN